MLSAIAVPVACSNLMSGCVFAAATIASWNPNEVEKMMSAPWLIRALIAEAVCGPSGTFSL